MKTIAYALYVLTVLLISGLARANADTLVHTTTQYQTPATIDQVTVDSSQTSLVVAGSFPNPCYAAPSAMLVQDSSNPTVLVLHMTSPTPQNDCYDKVQDFNTSVELPRLAAISGVKLDSRTVYTVKVQGNEFSMPIPGSDLILLK